MSPETASRPAGLHGSDRLLTAVEVADWLGVSTGWIYREVRLDRMPHVLLGRNVRFRREAIESWLCNREQGGRL